MSMAIVLLALYVSFDIRGVYIPWISFHQPMEKWLDRGKQEQVFSGASMIASTMLRSQKIS